MSKKNEPVNSLQVRNLPTNIYEHLSKQAKAEHRSLAQQAIIVLAKGLNIEIDPSKKRKELLEKIAARDEVNIDSKLNPVDLIREDRER